MKYIITIIILLITISIYSQKITITKDNKGNLIEKIDTKSTNQRLNQTYTDKSGKVYPIYKSTRGKLFIIKVSKSGKEYKKYIQTN